jgi:antitoxin ParD1/3/4
MNVSLTPALEKLIHSRVATGRYGSASEVVREALRLLEERDRIAKGKLRDLRSALGLGIQQLDRGEGADVERRTAARIRSRGRKKLAGVRPQA